MVARYRVRGLTLLVAALCCVELACSKPASAPKSKVLVAVTVDWEGAYFSGPGLDALDALRRSLGANVPLTHFVCAAYFSKKDAVDPQAIPLLASGIREIDEVALHLHGWRSLAEHARIAPKLSPSFLTGTSELVEFPDGDVGFDVDLDVYTVDELRALIRASRDLLAPTHIPLSKAFRAGGYLATPKVLQAIHDEGLSIDSSAAAHTQFGAPKDKVLRERIAEVWPNVTTATQPFSIKTPGGAVHELPISLVIDYSSTAAVVDVVEAARAQLGRTPGRDVLVVIALHQESADEFAPLLVAAFKTLQARADLAGVLEFSTISSAAQRLTSPTP